MRRIRILGPGCAKCDELERNVRAAVAGSGAQIEIEKVTDIKEIMGFGVMLTPALVIDGEVKSSGKVLSVDEIVGLLGR
jgi:small redox-active disulfide protein 2